MWPNRGGPYGAPPGGPRPDFSQPPPGYHAGMPPPTFRPSGSNSAPLPPRAPPSSASPYGGNGTPSRGGPGIGAPGPGGPGGGGGGGGGPPQGNQTTLFIGGISPGVSDEILEQLLNACGQLRSLKRVRGATGKPQPFGFAEFEDPDAVLRALVVLNGIELPNIEARSEPGKKLIVKADEKTRAFLDEYEKLMLRTDADDELEASSVRSITHILSSLTTAQPLPPSSSTALSSVSGGAPSSSAAPSSGRVSDTPVHLRDLSAEDLPEDKRAGVLSQIGMFRGTQAERERERKRHDDERERLRVAALVREQTRAREASSSHVGAAASPAAAQAQRNPYAPRGQHDPQSYNQPVAFVAAGGAAAGSRWPHAPGGGGAVERTDEEEEEARKERRRRAQLDTKRERERRLEQRERQRLQHLDREANVDRARTADDQRAAEAAREREARWDSDDEDTRDVWVADRHRWRSQRQVLRRREQEADAADAKQEHAEIEQAARETEAFLARQAAELAELAVKQKAAGILTDEVAPVKLSIGPSAAAAAAHGHAPVSKERKGVAFEQEDEDEGKKKRVLVKLDPLEGLSGPEREHKRRTLLQKLKSKVPTEKDAVFGFPVVWAAVSEDVIASRLRPAARAKLEEYLGELEDEDLLSFALDHVRERKAPGELVDGLEPVLEDDALAFALSFYRTLIFESLAADEGVNTEGFAF